MPYAIIPANTLDVGAIDFQLFGITGTQVMRGTEVMQMWVPQ